MQMHVHGSVGETKIRTLAPSFVSQARELDPHAAQGGAGIWLNNSNFCTESCSKGSTTKTRSASENRHKLAIASSQRPRSASPMPSAGVAKGRTKDGRQQRLAELSKANDFGDASLWKALYDVFYGFCGATCDGREFAKLCKECGLYDKTFTSMDADVIYTNVRQKAERTALDYEEFKEAVWLIAKRKGVTTEAVQRQVIEKGGPKWFETTVDPNRFHEDKASYVRPKSQNAANERAKDGGNKRHAEANKTEDDCDSGRRKHICDVIHSCSGETYDGRESAGLCEESRLYDKKPLSAGPGLIFHNVEIQARKLANGSEELRETEDELAVRIAANCKGWALFTNYSTGERGFYIPEVADSVVYASWVCGLRLLPRADHWLEERGRAVPAALLERLIKAMEGRVKEGEEEESLHKRDHIRSPEMARVRPEDGEEERLKAEESVRIKTAVTQIKAAEEANAMAFTNARRYHEAWVMAEAEAMVEAKLSAMKEARREFVKAARAKAEQEMKAKAKDAARLQAQEEIRSEAGETCWAKAEKAAKTKAVAAENEARVIGNQNVMARAVEEAKAQDEARSNACKELKAAVEKAAWAEAEQEMKALTETAARLKAKEEARIEAEEAIRVRANEEAIAQVAEYEARARRDQQSRISAEDEAKIHAEEEAIMKIQNETKIIAEKEARAKAEFQMKTLAQVEARFEAVGRARVKAEEEMRGKAEEAAKVEVKRTTAEARASLSGSDSAAVDGVAVAARRLFAVEALSSERDTTWTAYPHNKPNQRLQAAEEAKVHAEEEARANAESTANVAAEEKARGKSEEKERSNADEEKSRLKATSDRTTARTTAMTITIMNATSGESLSDRPRQRKSVKEIFDSDSDSINGDIKVAKSKSEEGGLHQHTMEKTTVCKPWDCDDCRRHGDGKVRYRCKPGCDFNVCAAGEGIKEENDWNNFAQGEEPVQENGRGKAVHGSTEAQYAPGAEILHENDWGNAVHRSTQLGYTHLFYCGRSFGIMASTNSDGRCGPNDGPQCSSCKRFQTAHDEIRQAQTLKHVMGTHEGQHQHLHENPWDGPNKHDLKSLGYNVLSGDARALSPVAAYHPLHEFHPEIPMSPRLLHPSLAVDPHLRTLSTSRLNTTTPSRLRTPSPSRLHTGLLPAELAGLGTSESSSAVRKAGLPSSSQDTSAARSRSPRAQYLF